jgi:hypothetical protein
VRVLEPDAVQVEVRWDDGADAGAAAAHPRRGPVRGPRAVPPAAAAVPAARIRYRDGHELSKHDPYYFAPQLSDFDLYLFGEGNHYSIYYKLGAHPAVLDGLAGTRFAVWAPNAERVSVVGPFNLWDGRKHALQTRGASGIWELFIPDVGPGTAYKFEIRTRTAARCSRPTRTASRCSCGPATARWSPRSRVTSGRTRRGCSRARQAIRWCGRSTSTSPPGLVAARLRPHAAVPQLARDSPTS